MSKSSEECKITNSLMTVKFQSELDKDDFFLLSKAVFAKKVKSDNYSRSYLMKYRANTVNGRIIDNLKNGDLYTPH